MTDLDFIRTLSGHKIAKVGPGYIALHKITGSESYFTESGAATLEKPVSKVEWKLTRYNGWVRV